MLYSIDNSMVIDARDAQQGVPELLHSSYYQASQRLFEEARLIAGDVHNLTPNLISERAKIHRTFGELDTAFDLLNSITSPTDQTIDEYIELTNQHASLGNNEIAVTVLTEAVSSAKRVRYDRDGYNVTNNFAHLTLAFSNLGEASLAVSTLKNVEGEENEIFRTNILYEVVHSLAEHVRWTPLSTQ